MVPKLVLVPGGYFLQGDTLGNNDEKPTRKIRISDFYIGETELTRAQFQEFIETTGYQTDAERGEGSYIWSSLGWVKKAGISWRHDETGRLRPAAAGEYPVVHVSWFDAARYCNWLSAVQKFKPVYIFENDSVKIDTAGNGFRLPTEAEWEFAAGGGNTRENCSFSGSAYLSEVAWYSGNAQKGAHPVGQKKANTLGLFDCSGNVWEWCQDWYAPDSYTGLPDSLNPAGPASGVVRAIRGGSWSNNPGHCRISNRSSRYPDGRDCNLGFRLARSVK